MTTPKSAVTGKSQYNIPAPSAPGPIRPQPNIVGGVTHRVGRAGGDNMSSGSSSVPPAPWSASFSGPVQTSSTRTAAMTKLAFKGSDKLPGGLADNKSKKDFDPKSMREGVRVEREHVRSKGLAEEITSDHLTEDPQYYRKLKKMESSEKTALDPAVLGDFIAPENSRAALSAIGHGLAQAPLIKQYLSHGAGASHALGSAVDAFRLGNGQLNINLDKLAPLGHWARHALGTHIGANAIGYALTKPAGRAALNALTAGARKLRDLLPGGGSRAVEIAANDAMMAHHFPEGMRQNVVGGVHSDPHHVLAHGLESRLFERSMGAALQGKKVNDPASTLLNTAAGPEYGAQLTLGDQLGEAYRKSYRKKGVYRALRKLRGHLADPRLEELMHQGMVAPVVSGLNDLVSSRQRPAVAVERPQAELVPGLGEFLPGQEVRLPPPDVDTFVADPERYKTTAQKLFDRGSRLFGRVRDGGAALAESIGRGVGRAVRKTPVSKYLDPRRPDMQLADRGSEMSLGERAATALPLVLAGAVSPGALDHFALNAIRSRIANSSSGQGVMRDAALEGLFPKGYLGDKAAKGQVRKGIEDVVSSALLSPAVPDPRNAGATIRDIVTESPGIARQLPVARQLVGREIAKRLATKGPPSSLQLVRDRANEQLDKLDPVISSQVRTLPGEVAGSVLEGKGRQLTRRAGRLARNLINPRLTARMAEKGFKVTTEMLGDVANSVVNATPGIARAIVDAPGQAIDSLAPPVKAMLAKGGPQAIRAFANAVAGHDHMSLNTARGIYRDIESAASKTTGQLRSAAGAVPGAQEVYNAVLQSPEALQELLTRLKG